ncbi:GNAT family N-acetyltransferase [Halococcoides cellulosivorans]|uniref:GNAT family N-acetyltransferase n=1 Tax=Halococcoides cellulosivorans TaxID=1679096 RepID=A0A2R4X1V3_9EURY|nr:GNAT family protein [Halococcoides cellulosivorans]AWB27777.1 GNAT family N-acetyltransferase [Halococcoides cellulosivorans]
MPGPVFVRGETVTLHSIEPEDAETVASMVNDPEVWPSLAVSEPHSAADERDWIDSLSEADGHHFLIRVDEATVGVIGLNHPDPVWGHAELGVYLRPDAQGNGYAADAIRRVCRWAFEDRRLHKIFSNVYETNPASKRMLQAVGFTHEGTFREHAFVRGAYRDVERYGLLAGEIVDAE